ncbi:hypothetical protein BJL95_04920 [Methylomonas sp. LWB]|uniref:Lcl C-terminal domain-containing protein n=1 Tax=Methylomonas sp. LWB TaxID=1905845 RepID=UPI0008D98729|nr:DUF1566 domain-containing protein [Methylomonas sp. LWB]OHX37914.1 hypothetical protein BJL95_04920 [Methylomonas sp. LWB]
MTHRLLTFGVLLGAAAFNANATLISFTGADDVGLVYSSVGNVTWTQDANLLATLESTYGFRNVIQAIIAASPTVSDTPNSFDGYTGSYTVKTTDFSSDGRANWFGAQAFVGLLNRVNYGGSSQWRLPTSNAIDGYDGSAGNELGQLVYRELDGSASNSIPNTSSFDHEQASSYWSGTENAASPGSAWYFEAYYSSQANRRKTYQHYVWAVSPGRLSAVPIPGAVWLMGSGLMGLLGLKRRGRVG